MAPGVARQLRIASAACSPGLLRTPVTCRGTAAVSGPSLFEQRPAALMTAASPAATTSTTAS